MQRGVRLRSIKDMRARYDALDPLLWRKFSVADEMQYEAANAPEPASEWVWLGREFGFTGEGPIPMRPFITQIPPAGRLP